jgi:hypothetical protein
VRVSKAGAAAIALSSFFASAQGRGGGLDLRIQVGIEKCRPSASIFIPPKDQGQVDDPSLLAQPGHQSAPQIRMLGALPGGGGLYYELGGRLEAFSLLDYNRAYDNGLTVQQIDAREVEVSYSYFGFGVAYMYCPKWGLGLGLHLEGRLERITTSGQVYIGDASGAGAQEPIIGRLDGAVTYLRPWGRVSLDFTFNNHGRLRPFVGADVALPLMERQQKNAFWALDQPQESRLLESISPDRSVTYYIGFRL